MWHLTAYAVAPPAGPWEQCSHERSHKGIDEQERRFPEMISPVLKRHIIGQHQSSSSIFIISSANGTTGKTSQTCLFPFLKSARFLNLFKHDWKWLNLHHCVKPVTLALTWESATVMFSCFPSGQASVLLAPFVPLFIAFSQTPLMAMCLLINTLTSGKR